MSNDIIEMAREAGFTVNEKSRQHQPKCIFHTHYMVDDLLERFAALVRADERDRATRENAYVLAEREACAKFFEDHWRERWTDEQVAEAIRARGNT